MRRNFPLLVIILALPVIALFAQYPKPGNGGGGGSAPGAGATACAENPYTTSGSKTCTHNLNITIPGNFQLSCFDSAGTVATGITGPTLSTANAATFSLSGSPTNMYCYAYTGGAGAKGDKGDKGDTGTAGAPGTGAIASTTAPICGDGAGAGVACTKIPVAYGGLNTTAPAFTGQTDGATITWALGSALVASGSVTLAGSRTLAITGPVSGGSYVLRVTQDGTGSRALTLGTGCTWKVSGGGSGAVTLSTAPGTVDVLAFMYDGANCLATLTKNLN